MTLSGGRGIKAAQYYSNEQANSADFNFMALETYQNEIELLAMIANNGDVDDPSTIDTVIAGLLATVVSGLNVTLSAGAAVSFTGTYFDPTTGTGFTASSGKIFGVINPADQVIAFGANAGANTRYDIVEIQPVINSYNTQSRQFADPVTHQITTANVSTRYEFGINIVVKPGNAAIPNTYPTVDAGYIKVLEVAIPTSASTPSYVYDARQSGLWNGNIGNTRCIKEKVRYRPQDATAAPVVFSLPLASSVKGIEFIIMKSDSSANSVTINTTGSDFINGVGTSIVLSEQNEYYVLRSVASGLWIVIQKNILGEIEMFDANNAGGGSGGSSGGWTDNVTRPGWYACISANSSHGCPNLVSSFIMGKVVAGAGSTGGSNTHTIASAELPPHTHSTPNHSHSLSNHTHTVALGTHSHSLSVITGSGFIAEGGSSLCYFSESAIPVGTTNLTDLGTPASSGPSVNSTDTSGGGTTNDGAFANTAIDIRPAYYALLFIRHCH